MVGALQPDEVDGGVRVLACVRELVYTRPSPREEAELQQQSAAAWHAFMAFRALLRDDGGRQRDLYAQPLTPR